MRDIDRVFAAMDEIFAQVGLEDYVGTASFEYTSRPILEVGKPEASAALVAVCQKWFPLIMKRVLRKIAVPTVTLDNRSKIGSPIRKRVDDKLRVVAPFLEDFAEGNFSSIERDNLALQGVRIQHERRSKVRKYTFSSPSGVAVTREVGEDARLIDGRLCGRTRLVINPAVGNLALLAVDNAIHSSLLSWKSVKPDVHWMRTKGIVADAFLAIDWKNFDQQAGPMAIMYASLISDEYVRMFNLLNDAPVLCMATGWRDSVKVAAAPNFVSQFKSGLSSVAPIGKFVCLSANAEFISSEFGLTEDATLDALEEGSYRDFGFRNYGDDNEVFGHKRRVDNYVRKLSSMARIELEDPPKFLGDVYSKDALGAWKGRLDHKSYFLNWYTNERAPGTIFRPFPCFGFVARRRDYAAWGPPDMHKYFALEDRVLAAHGIRVTELFDRAQKEAADIGRMAVDYRLRFEKSYLLTDDEKAKLPEYQQLDRALVLRLISRFAPSWNLR